MKNPMTIMSGSLDSRLAAVRYGTETDREKYLADADSRVRCAVAQYGNDRQRDILATDPDENVRCAVARYGNDRHRSRLRYDLSDRVAATVSSCWSRPVIAVISHIGFSGSISERSEFREPDELLGFLSSELECNPFGFRISLTDDCDAGTRAAVTSLFRNYFCSGEDEDTAGTSADEDYAPEEEPFIPPEEDLPDEFSGNRNRIWNFIKDILNGGKGKSDDMDREPEI